MRRLQVKSQTLQSLAVALVLAAVAGAQTKMSGTIQCGKPDPQHMIEAGDRANHSYMIGKVNCTWTKTFEIAGVQSKDGGSTFFEEISGNSSRGHAVHTTTMANGDKAYVRYQGTSTYKDGAPQSAEGKWSFTGGTGKLKGLKGQGTTKGKAGADGSVTYEIEGEYQLPTK